jgi:hypothetical protein
MPVDEQAEKSARAELLDLKTEWEKIIKTLKDVQLSHKEERYYLERLWQIKDGFKYRYSHFISVEFHREAIGIFNTIGTDLDLALRKGRENYDRERHRQRIEWARALGLGAIILLIIFAIIFVIGKLVFNVEIPFSPLK